MLSSLRARNINCEEEAKFTQDRILLVEKHLAEFCHTIAQYSRKASKVRDKGDTIAEVASMYGESEQINKSLSLGLTNFANAFATISDYGDARVRHIDNKVVNELSHYDSICKQAKGEVKQIFGARDKELVRKRQLDRIRERNPANRDQIVQAETELFKATSEVSRTIKHLEDRITSFERQKLHDIKTILLDFIAVEMGYHAKALELLTKAYTDIDAIDEDADLEEFKKSLQISEVGPQVRPKGVRSQFRASQSLGSINNIFSTSHKNRSPGIPTPAARTTTPGISKSEETLDSLKHDLSETSETNSDQDNSSGYTEQSQEKVSPVVARRYLK